MTKKPHTLGDIAGQLRALAERASAGERIAGRLRQLAAEIDAATGPNPWDSISDDPALSARPATKWPPNPLTDARPKIRPGATADTVNDR